MKSAVETLSPTRVRLTVEVPFADLRPSLDTAYRRLARQVRIAGFRPGKVPPRILDQRLGRGVVLEEAVNDAVPHFYGEAVRESGVATLGHPEVSVTSFADGQELVFTAEVDVRPTIELPDYAGLPVTVEAVEPPEELVEEQLAAMRERFAVLTTVDRPAAAGDYLLLDLKVSSEGNELPDAGGNGLSYEIGGPEPVAGLSGAVTGLTEGGTAEFDTVLTDAERAGRPARVAVTVRSVKAKELPELDDEFARTASEFDTLAELRADLRDRLTRVRRLQQSAQARDRALAALLERVDAPLPEAVVADEVEHRRRALDEQLAAAGVSRADWLSAQGRSEAEVTAELESDARQTIKAQFVLDAIAQQEQLGVSEAELTDAVVRRAQRVGLPADDYARRLAEAGAVGSVWADVLRGKALALVTDRAAFTDEAGRPVDLAALRAELAAEAASPPASSEPDAGAADPGPTDAEAPDAGPADGAAAVATDTSP